MIRIVINISKQTEDLLIRAQLNQGFIHTIIQNCQRAQEDRNRNSALAIEFQDDEIVLAGLQLHPGSPIRDQLGGRHHATRSAIQLCLKIHARRPDQLRHDNTFGSINDERALLGHLREIAKEKILLLLFAQFAAFQQYGNVERTGIGQITLEAFLNRVLGGFEPILEIKLFGKRGVAGKMQS